MSVELKLPPIYHRNGKDCYLDPIRQKLIYITPEEPSGKSNLISDRYPEGAFRYDRCRTTPFPLWTEHKETCRYCNTQAG